MLVPHDTTAAVGAHRGAGDLHFQIVGTGLGAKPNLGWHRDLQG